MDKIFKYRCKKADGLNKPLCENMPEVLFDTQNPKTGNLEKNGIIVVNDRKNALFKRI